MDAGMALVTLRSVFALFVGLGVIIARVDGLAFLAPQSTKHLLSPALDCCTHGCRTADGLCPLTHSREGSPSCPLWKFVDVDVPTSMHGSPFAHLLPA